MNTEWEAKFTNINVQEIRTTLKSLNAKLLRAEYFQKRVTFFLPKGHEIEGGWIRVRDEGDKVTTALKIVDGKNIADQKELNIVVDNFEETRTFLKMIGCVEKSYQENKRELWSLKNVEITIDTWPFLEAFMEIEGKSKIEVKEVSELIGFDWKNAIFGAVPKLYSQKYNIPEVTISNKIPKIVFDEPNPFL